MAFICVFFHVCVVKDPDAAEISEGEACSEGRGAWRPAPEHNNNPSTITMVTTVPP